MKDYSQYGEQKIILDYFKDFKGNLLDIGANDGETLSNSRALTILGWSAILVEPSVTSLNKLYNLYQNSNIVEIAPFAISDKSGPVIFYDSGSHLGNGDHGLLSTLIESELERWKISGEIFTENEVQSITYKELQDLTENKPYDFITIDAEGKDLDILKQIDLSETKLLCIEYNGNREVRNHIVHYSDSYGLSKILLENGCNIILAR